MESIDPVNEMTWRVDCYGGGEEEGGKWTLGPLRLYYPCQCGRR